MFKRFYTTAMYTQRKTLETRFLQIRKVRTHKKYLSIVGIILAVMLLTTSVFASGILQNAAYDEYTIEIINAGQRLVLENKPFVENGEVYLPLREMLTAFGISHRDSGLDWEDGRITVSVAQDRESVVTGATPVEAGSKTISFIHQYSFEIGSVNLRHSPADDIVREMANAPVLVGDIAYVPFELLRIISEDSPCFLGLGLTVYGRDGEVVFQHSYPLSQAMSLNGGAEFEGTIQTSFAPLEFSISFPNSWNNKVLIEQNETMVIVYHKEIYEDWNGAGALFCIERVEGSYDDSEAVTPTQTILAANGYTYLFHTPSDVQYPIWDGGNPEQAADYLSMCNDFEGIKASIAAIQ